MTDWTVIGALVFAGLLVCAVIAIAKFADWIDRKQGS